MTRETKIGLLVGLGFIVVFAVLLSHTGSVPTLEGDLPAEERGDPTLPIDRVSLALVPQDTEVDTPAIPVDPPPSRAAGASHSSGDPGAVGRTTEDEGTENGDLPEVFPDVPPSWLDPADEGLASTGRMRIAPYPVPNPEPTDREDPLIVTERPGEEPIESPPTEPAPSTDDGLALALPKPPEPPALLKTLTVVSGDTLGKISGDVYGSIKHLRYLYEMNKDVLDSEDKVMAGQVLKIYELPAELFEPAPHMNLGDLRSGAPIFAPGELSEGSRNRRAPPAAGGDELETPSRGGNGSVASRRYVIRENDTFSKIARKELGSENLWPEIEKLNPRVKPKLLTVGTEIRLPNKRLDDASVARGRTAG